MGCSFELLQKDFLILSLDVDRSISIELSTGFTGQVKARTGTSIDVTVDELSTIISDLTGIYRKLLLSKTCPDCELINPPESLGCVNCGATL